ncbi:MAG TPA: nucleoside recognition domain-containing protein, partial [Tenuifilaceae bacterium]|nr:nucleoside recognition domain-containing protein [Tenuifilaceae bacterium]
RIPTLRSILIHMWDKASQYLNKIGGVILVGVIIIWALGYFPRNVQTSKDYDSLIGLKRAALTSAQATNAATAESLEQEIQEIEMEREALRQEQSYLGRIGKFIEPALKPLGFDWKMGVSLISGIAAKEIVVSTLGVLHLAKEPNGSQSLPDKLKADIYTTGEKVGQKVFTPLSSFSFLIFILIYFPCVAVISAIKQESGSWKWALFTIVFTTALAWVSSFLFFQVGTLITGS